MHVGRASLIALAVATAVQGGTAPEALTALRLSFVVSIILLVPSIALLFITERFLKTEYLSSAFGKF
jgi:hypothetical protein